MQTSELVPKFLRGLAIIVDDITCFGSSGRTKGKDDVTFCFVDFSIQSLTFPLPSSGRQKSEEFRITSAVGVNASFPTQVLALLAEQGEFVQTTLLCHIHFENGWTLDS